MPTYDFIAEATIVTAGPSVTFSSIPNTYTDLVILLNMKGAAPANVFFRFNGDSGTNYRATGFSGTGSAGVGTSSTNDAQWGMTWTGASANDIWVGGEVHIFEYTNTNMWKNMVSRYSSSNEATFMTGQWSDTTAINTILISSLGNNYAVGSMFSLYGIKAG